MSFLRLRAVTVAFGLGCAPALWLGACGSTPSTSGSEDGGGDGTTDGTAADDGPGGDVDARGGGDGGMTSDGGGANEGGICKPGCPSNVTCGRYTDCTGQTLVCGMGCPKGQTCTGNPNGAQSCQPTPSCNGQCGEIGVDPCGVPINCGGCPTGQTCVNNMCIVQPPSDGGTGTCQPLTCNPSKNVNLCGTVGDCCGKWRAAK